MVFFVCEGCNESMKKNQVDKHAARCRSCHAVTCVDCSVTFYGNDYATHLTCVSEAEKYEKTLYKAKVVTKLNPQEAWTALIEEAASRSEEAPKHLRENVNRLNDLGNVPRNKNKFINFVKNSMKMYNTNSIEEIWNFLEKLKEQKNLEKTAAAAAAAPKTDIKSEVKAEVEKNAVEITSKADESKTEEEVDIEKQEKKARKAERKRIRESANKVEEQIEIVVEEAEIQPKDEKKKSKKHKKQKQESA